MSQSNLKRHSNQPLNVGVSHSRSLSQSAFFTNSCLPPLSPYPPSESSRASSNSSLKDASMEFEMDVSSRGSPFPPFPKENMFRSNDSLPPRSGHRRSNSDVPLGFSAMIQSSPQLVPISGQEILGRRGNVRETSVNQKPVGLERREIDTFNYGKSGVERKLDGEILDYCFSSLMNMDKVDHFNSSAGVDKDKDSQISGDSSNTESDSVSRNDTGLREGVKRSAVGDIAPPARHYRSLSMDSAIGKFHLGNESPKLQTSLVNGVDQLSPSNSISENSTMLNLDLGDAEFNDFELKKIMSDERLAEIAAADPKRAKRILANRQSAARSKERKLRYISELEHKVQTLQTESTTLSSQVTILQKNYTELTNQNNELKIRVQAMEQQAQLRDALNEALTAEVQRLKLASMELSEEGQSSDRMALMRHQIFSMQRSQPNQMQQLSSTGSTTNPTAPASA